MREYLKPIDLIDGGEWFDVESMIFVKRKNLLEMVRN